MTDYKKLCTELVDEIEGWVAYGLEGQLQLLDEIDIANAHVLIDRARAALAEPEPDVVDPTDEEILELADQIDELDYEQIDVPPWYRGDDFHTYRAGYASGWADGVSAVLARYGRPAPVPDDAPLPLLPKD